MQDSLTVADVSKSGVSRHVLGLRKLRPVLLSHWTLSPVLICSRGYRHNNDKPVTLFAVKSAAFLPISSASNFCKKCAQVMPFLHAQKACSFQHGGPKGRDQHSGKRSHEADHVLTLQDAKSQTCIYGDFREWEGGPGIHELCWNYHRNAFQFQPCRLLTRYLQARQAFLVLVLETIGAFAHCPCKLQIFSLWTVSKYQGKLPYIDWSTMSTLAGNLIRPNGSRTCWNSEMLRVFARYLPLLVPTWNSTQVLSELQVAPFPHFSWSWQELLAVLRVWLSEPWADFFGPFCLIASSWMIAGSACAWSLAIGQPQWNCLNPRVAVQSLIVVTSCDNFQKSNSRTSSFRMPWIVQQIPMQLKQSASWNSCSLISPQSRQH